MPDRLSPIVGQWYSRDDMGQRFMVTGYDEQSGTVEIQSSEGDLDELAEDIWRSIPIHPVEPSQDWTEPLDTEPAADDELRDDQLDSEGSAGPGNSPEVANEPEEIDRTGESPARQDEGDAL